MVPDQRLSFILMRMKSGAANAPECYLIRSSAITTLWSLTTSEGM